MVQTPASTTTISVRYAIRDKLDAKSFSSSSWRRPPEHVPPVLPAKATHQADTRRCIRGSMIYIASGEKLRGRAGEGEEQVESSSRRHI